MMFNVPHSPCCIWNSNISSRRTLKNASMKSPSDAPAPTGNKTVPVKMCSTEGFFSHLKTCSWPMALRSSFFALGFALLMSNLQYKQKWYLQYSQYIRAHEPACSKQHSQFGQVSGANKCIRVVETLSWWGCARSSASLAFNASSTRFSARTIM